jgi:hypothetical protein
MSDGPDPDQSGAEAARVGVVAPAAILCLLLAVIAAATGWRAALTWMRDATNANVILALAAVAQVVLAAVLALLTLNANRRADREARSARAQAVAMTTPRIVFRDPVIAGTPSWIKLTAANIGFGPAIHVTFDTPRGPGWAAYRISGSWATSLAAGQQLVLSLLGTESMNRAYLGRHSFGVSAIYSDIYGKQHNINATVSVDPSSGSASIAVVVHSKLFDSP